MANPRVRPHLHFYPEDSGQSLSEARQAAKWLHELPSEDTTPMIRIQNDDYYILEPALLIGGHACIPNQCSLEARCYMQPLGQWNRLPLMAPMVGVFEKIPQSKFRHLSSRTISQGLRRTTSSTIFLIHHKSLVISFTWSSLYY